ncbi:MAG: 3'-5' exonuclease, partial [Spirochaetota bacterium]
MSKIICLDTETTGADREDRILQLAYLIAEPGCDIQLHNAVCNPGRSIKYDAMAIHHITPEQVENCPSLVHTREYRTLLSINSPDNYLVIQNAKFDLEMLAKDGFTSNMKLIDTMKVSQHALQDSPRHGLQYLRYSLGLYKKEDQFQEMIKAHDALGDVIVLYLLYQYFCESGLTPDEMVELTAQPVLLKTFSFGK